MATLVREAFEENQVRVGVTVYLGYQEVHRPGRAPARGADAHSTAAGHRAGEVGSHAISTGHEIAVFARGSARRVAYLR